MRPALLLMVAATIALPLHGRAEDCAGVNQATKKTGVYHFTFESSVDKSEKGDSFLFARCVQTKNDETMFVDWKGAGVSGFARPGKPVSNSITWPTKDEETIKTDLWYGAARDKAEAPYKEVKDKTAAETKHTPILVSRVKMSIPVWPKKATDFVAVDMQFTSETKMEGDEYRCVHTWKSGIVVLSGPPIQFRLKSPAFADKDDGKGGKQRDLAKLTHDPQQFERRWQKPPVCSVRVVEFYDPPGKEVVGTACVAIYEPKGVEK